MLVQFIKAITMSFESVKRTEVMFHFYLQAKQTIIEINKSPISNLIISSTHKENLTHIFCLLSEFYSLFLFRRQKHTVRSPVCGGGSRLCTFYFN